MGPVPSKLMEKHIAAYGGSPWQRIFACPGRINLIGEHIDYNGGHVLPAAINRSVYLCISPNDGDSLRLTDMHFERSTELTLNSLRSDKINIEQLWLYPYGAIHMLREHIVRGYNISYLSDIPAGAGVSSSAAITTVTLHALAEITGIKIPGDQLAKMGQRVEKEYAGVSCGIMDQFTVINGKKDHALLLDTRTLEFEYLPIGPSVHFILVNSGIKHSLRDTGYNERRDQCDNALRILQNNGHDIQYLCELTAVKLEESRPLLPATEYKRAMHAVAENERTLNFYRHIKDGDYPSAGKLLYGSHDSLRDLFEVSIPEIDLMVQWSRDFEGVHGARMMGGGFGGCTINMVDSRSSGIFMKKMTSRYREAFNTEPMMINCTLEDGVRELRLN